jgi:heme A synthase
VDAPARFRRFALYAWAVLGYNVLVVLWGAYVRATGSGAGCGNHWPLCNGELAPRAPRLETIIEFTHRVTSGLSLLAVFALWLWSRRLYPRGHRARMAAALSVAFLVTEALLGAGLVLFRYVERNASAGRAAYLSAHLANTQVLLAVLTLTAWFAPRPAKWPGWRAAPRLLLAALSVAVVVSVTGAIAALGDTLFPAASIAEGVRQEFNATSSLLLRLRLLHPAFAVAGGLFLLYAASSALRLRLPAEARRAAWLAAVFVLLQVAAGGVNILLLAPVWMQLAHLLIADLLWIALVMMVAGAAEAGARRD